MANRHTWGQMNNLEIIANYNDLCGECPVWDGLQQQLFWTDCVGQRFYRYDWRTHKHEIVQQGVEINGFVLNEPGGFIVTNNSGIWYWQTTGELHLIANNIDGKKCQMNDCTSDPAGRLISGSWFYDPNNDFPRGDLIQVDTDGTARVLDGGFKLANGLGFSPDGRTLYFADSAERRIYAYDYDIATGAAKNRRVFVDVPVERGLPDGLSVDSEGFVWSAEWYGSRVVRYDPEGKLERTILTPAKQTSSLAFGGPDLTSIFVTSASKSEAMPIMPKGYDPLNGNFGGPLYRIDSEVAGKPALRTRICVPGA
jgi:sugar lactone lactonase YvrE